VVQELGVSLSIILEINNYIYNIKTKNMTYNFTVAVESYATEGDYPATGSADVLYTNAATDVIKYWANNTYNIYVGPRPHR